MKNKSDHYDSDYFKWQSDYGQFGGWANLTKFSHYIRHTDTVLDFGCGGGYLLNQIHCKKRLGVEINSSAHKTAQNNGIKVFNKINQVPNNSADVIISNHALEHSLNPYYELKQLFRILKPEGKIVICVPCESVLNKYVPNDINHHVFTWSPLCLGNLLGEAGFKVIESKGFISAWPPKSWLYGRLLGHRLFNILCLCYGFLRSNTAQVKVVGIKQ